MKTAGRLTILVLPFALACTLFAQHSSRKNSETEPTVVRGSSNTAPKTSQTRTKSYVPETPAANHPRTPHHSPQFHNNGGFAYYPYYPTYGYAPDAYAPTPLVSGQTATDRLLANGGTFTLVDSAPGEVQPESEATSEPRPQAPVAQALPTTEVRSVLPATSFAAPDYATGVATAVEESPAILVFADGRRSEVRNYAVFGGSVIVMGAQRQKIPLSQLDLKATLAANENAGYTFRIPAVYLK